MPELCPSKDDLTSATGIARAIRARAVTSEQVVAASLARAAASEAGLRAWHCLDPEVALVEARRRDREPARGGLHGVPVAIKDLSDTTNLPTAYGAPAYRGHRPRMDAACVAAIRAAGGVIVGKTATVEFGATRPCETRNPRNSAHTPGGSSSGSAAVVADGQVPLATGTQTGGSIIRPAAFCGVVGFKPTYGALPLAGTKSYAWSLDTLGGFAASVADVALLFDALRGSNTLPLDDEPPFAPRLGIFRDPLADRASGPALDALEDVARACLRRGALLQEVAAPAAFARSLDWQRTISRFELGRSLLPERVTFTADALGADLRREIDEGLAVDEDHYTLARAAGRALAAELDAILADLDALLTLATPGEAPRGLDSTGDATFCLSWSLAGLPTLSLPAGTGPEGLPLAIQLVGPRHRDRRFLRVSAWVEAAVANT